MSEEKGGTRDNELSDQRKTDLIGPHPTLVLDCWLHFEI
jgi:hypothetical protein